MTVVLLVVVLNLLAVVVLWRRAAHRLGAAQRRLADVERRATGWQSVAERRREELAGAATVIALTYSRLNHANARGAVLYRDNLRLTTALRDVRERLEFVEIIAGQPSSFFRTGEIHE